MEAVWGCSLSRRYRHFEIAKKNTEHNEIGRKADVARSVGLLPFAVEAVSRYPGVRFLESCDWLKGLASDSDYAWWMMEE